MQICARLSPEGAALDVREPCAAYRHGVLLGRHSKTSCVQIGIKGRCHVDTYVQGDTSGCDEPPTDFKTKVPFWPGLSRPSQAKTGLLF